MATKYWMGDGGTNLWASDTCWSTTSSSGPNNTTHAIAGDDVILDVGSPNCTIAATAAAATLTCTGYTGTLTYNANLTLTGNITYGALMSLAADVITRVLHIAPTTGATWTANGKTHPCAIQPEGASQTHTLADTWIISGVLQPGSTTTVNSSGGTGISAVGLNAGAAMSGTALVTLTGGTWSGTVTTSSSITLAGNVTLSGAPKFTAGILTYSSGTITTTGATLTVTLPATMDTGGMTWNAVTVAGGNSTLTLNSALLATTLTFGASNSIYGGSAGFTVGTLTGTAAAARTITFTQTNTYTITTAFTLQGTGAFTWTLISSSGTLRVPFVLQAGASQSVSYVSATRIDSSAGDLIHSPGGTITDSLNWDTAGGAGGGSMWLFS